MTQKEVENVLGPSGDYSSGPLTVDISADEIWGEWKATPEDFAEGMLKSHRWFFKFFHGWYAREWASNNGIIQVAFDGSGKVEQKEFIDVRSRYENPFDRLRRCLRREERQVTIPVRVVSGGIGP